MAAIGASDGLPCHVEVKLAPFRLLADGWAKPERPMSGAAKGGVVALPDPSRPYLRTAATAASMTSGGEFIKSASNSVIRSPVTSVTS